MFILAFIELLIYFAVPIYDFPIPQPFSGSKIYNPYQGMDSSQWRKTNFHFHLRAWGGLTSGRGNTAQQFWSTYKKLGYNMSSVSDYQRINAFNKDSSFYIPAYEHGFSVRKKHQILVGARNVLWFDYSLFQNINHKQHIINLLRPDNEIVGLAHPGWENGYSAQIKRLGVPDSFIEHGTIAELHHECGYDTDGIYTTVKRMLSDTINI